MRSMQQKELNLMITTVCNCKLIIIYLVVSIAPVLQQISNKDNNKSINSEVGIKKEI